MPITLTYVFYSIQMDIKVMKTVFIIILYMTNSSALGNDYK